MSRKDEILPRIIEILKEFPNGLRYTELRGKLESSLPHIPSWTIHDNIRRAPELLSDKIIKPAQGIYILKKYIDEKPEDKDDIDADLNEKDTEKKFYQPFADYLVEELEECSKAIVLGGNKFGGKWGTPDVIGKLSPKASDIYKPQEEIVSAEIKINSKQLITAFGQACAYKLFSHKSYIVVPNKKSPDLSRLEALCLIFGIGLIVFDISNISNPEFDIRVRPNKHEPDSFYVNKYMKIIENELYG